MPLPILLKTRELPGGSAPGPPAGALGPCTPPGALSRAPGPHPYEARAVRYAHGNFPPPPFRNSGSAAEWLLQRGIIEVYLLIHSTKQVSPPPSIFSNISKSILPILFIQTVMNREFSYAKMSGICLPIDDIVLVKSCILWQKVWKKISHFWDLCQLLAFYTNNKGITHVSIYCIIYCMSLHVFILISITMNWMKCSIIIDRPTICFDHQSKYCWSKFVRRWPRPSAKCAGSIKIPRLQPYRE